MPKCDFIEIAFQHGCFPVDVLHIPRTPFPKNISGQLLLKFRKIHSKTPVFATLLKKKIWHKCLLENFAKFLRAPFLQSTSWRLLKTQVNCR